MTEIQKQITTALCTVYDRYTCVRETWRSILNDMARLIRHGYYTWSFNAVHKTAMSPAAAAFMITDVAIS